MSPATFSYAQAAKRHAAPPQNIQPGGTLATTSSGSHGKDEPLPSAVSVSASAPSATSTDAETRDSLSTVQTDTSAVKQGSERTSTQPSAPLTGLIELDGKMTREETSSTLRSRQVTDDKTSRSTSRTSRSNDGDSRKARQNKKSRGSEKEAESDEVEVREEVPEEPKPVFKEAAVPVVNPWTKRQEAHKVKAVPVAVAVPIVTPTAQATTRPAEGQAKGAASADKPRHDAHAEPHLNGEKLRHKSTDLSQAADHQVRRSGPRGSRGMEKDEKVNGTPPPVTDTKSFPDLKSATTGEAWRKIQDKHDRGDKGATDEAVSTKKQTKWQTLDVTPTYNTSYPQRISKLRGGARGGREAGTGRGDSTAGTGSRSSPVSGASNDRIAAAPSSQPSKPNQRPRDGSVSSTRLLPSQTNAARVNTMDVVANKEGRKSGPALNSEAPSEQEASAAPMVKGKSEGGKFSRGDGSKTPGDARLIPGYQWPPKSEYVKEIGAPPNYRAKNGRQNNGYGRGSNHAGVPGLSPVYPPNGVVNTNGLPGRPNPPQSPGHFPNYPPFVPNTSTQRGGMNPSSVGGRGTGRAPPIGHVGYANPPNAPYNTKNYAPYDYQPFPVPYGPNMGHEVEMVKKQIEYYLSLDNLLKDRYLRAHCDSQGFVDLKLIGSFPKLRNMLDLPSEDYLQLLRMACEQSDSIDYVVGDDDVERLRARGRWAQFVLPMDERDDTAKNEGPQRYIYRSFHSLNVHYPPHVMPVYRSAPAQMYHPASFAPEEQMYATVYGNDHPINPLLNGTAANGYVSASGSQLSAAVPEFSPVSTSPVVVKLEDLTNFQDDKLQNLVLVTSGPEPGSPARVDSVKLNGSAKAVPGQEGDKER